MSYFIAEPPRSSSKQPAAGFSLLELMIVIVIVGVLVSIFTLSVGSFSDNETSEHARRLQALIDLATEEATMQGREIGLRFYQHGYEFSVRAPGIDENGLQVWDWIPLDDDRLLRPRELGEEYALDLLIEDKEVDLDYARSEDDVYTPQIFLFSSGDILPAFKTRIRPSFSNAAILLTAATDGTIEIESDDF